MSHSTCPIIIYNLVFPGLKIGGLGVCVYWYIWMDSNRGCVSSWELTQVLGSGYSPPGMVVHTVEVGPDS